MSEVSLQHQITARDIPPSEQRIRRPVRLNSGPIWAPVATGWRYRELIFAMLRRQLADRFSGSLFGWGWAIAAPLITLAIYTVTFSRALRLPVASAGSGTMNYALSTFAGLIVFNLSAELCYRAPLLLHEYTSYIKTSIFPSETLAWTAVLRGLTYAGISLAVLLVFALALNWTLPVTVLLLPFLVVPMALLLLGFVWCLSALGAFTRDIAYLMITIVPLLMFATPVFYRISDLPPTFRTLEYFNPMAVEIDMARNILIDGVLPPLWLYGVFVVVALIVCRGGYAVFERYKGILVDVI
ncbi:MAG TPA: ABC transporter permease [Stellaceae bacterium]|nr:ABC transporter permease [Stellaceae bacterium]